MNRSIANLTRDVPAVPSLGDRHLTHAMRTPGQPPALVSMIRIRAAALADSHVDRAGSRAFGDTWVVNRAVPSGLRGGYWQ